MSLELYRKCINDGCQHRYCSNCRLQLTGRRQKQPRKAAAPTSSGPSGASYTRAAPLCTTEASTEPQQSSQKCISADPQPHSIARPPSTPDTASPWPTIVNGTYVGLKSLIDDNSTWITCDSGPRGPLTAFDFGPFSFPASSWPHDLGLPDDNNDHFEEHDDGQDCLFSGPGSVTAHHIMALHEDRDQTRMPQLSSIVPTSVKGKAMNATGHHKIKQGRGSSPRRPDGSSRRSSSPRSPVKPLDNAMEGGFTCPFVWSDPVRHRNCLKLKLRRISDIKQHLRRRHKQPPFCRRCKTIFKDETEEQDHSDTVIPCLLQSQESVPDGVTPTQFERLGKIRKDLVTQWNSIWDIIFPDSDQNKPASPFLDDRLSDEIKLLAVFSHTKGPGILQANAGFTPHSVDLVLRGVQTIIDEWISASINPALSD